MKRLLLAAALSIRRRKAQAWQQHPGSCVKGRGADAGCGVCFWS